MIKKKLMLSLLIITSFADITYSSSDVTPLECIEEAFCPVIIGFGVILLGVSFSNDYNNYVMSKSKKTQNFSISSINQTNITLNKFELSSMPENFIYPVCFLNETHKNLQKRCNQRSKNELKFLEKQSWDKLSPVAKKKYKKFGLYN